MSTSTTTEHAIATVSHLNRACPHCDGAGPFSLGAMNCLWCAAGDEVSAEDCLLAAAKCGYGADRCSADRAKAQAHRRDAMAQLEILGAPAVVTLAIAEVVGQFRRHRDRAEADLAELCMRRLEDEFAEKPKQSGAY